MRFIFCHANPFSVSHTCRVDGGEPVPHCLKCIPVYASKSRGQKCRAGRSSAGCGSQVSDLRSRTFYALGARPRSSPPTATEVFAT